MTPEKQLFLNTVNANRGIIKSLCKIYYTSSEDQQDAFQNILFQLWKSFGNFRSESKASTWIYRVSLNTILSQKRKADKSIVTEPINEFVATHSTPNTDDNLELLNLILESLNEIDKAIVILHLEGFKNKEIATILNTSATNISTRFNRLKKELKLKFNTEIYAS